MTWNKNILIFVLFFLFLVTPIHADKIEVVASTVGLNILFPNSDSVLKGSTPILNFVILNSTGFILNNSDVDCTGQIYDPVTFDIVGTLPLDNNPNEINKFIQLSLNSTRKIGTYTATLWCNSSQNEAGFLNTYYEVTNTGRLEDSNTTNWFTIIFYLVFMSLISIGLSLFISRDENNLVLRRGKPLQAFSMFFVHKILLYWGIINAFLTSLVIFGMTTTSDITNFRSYFIMYMFLCITILVYLIVSFFIFELEKFIPKAFSQMTDIDNFDKIQKR